MITAVPLQYAHAKERNNKGESFWLLKRSFTMTALRGVGGGGIVRKGLLSPLPFVREVSVEVPPIVPPGEKETISTWFVHLTSTKYIPRRLDPARTNK